MPGFYLVQQAKKLKPKGGVERGNNLYPLDEPEQWAEKLKKEENSFMLLCS